VVGVAVRGDVDRLEMLEQRRPLVPRRAGRALDDVVAVQGADRDGEDVLDPEVVRERADLRGDRCEAVGRPVHEVHLVDRRDDVADAEERGDVGVAAGLEHDAGARVDQHDREVRGRGAGEHVARVALVARRVGEDERPARGGEEPVRDIDGDALLALGAQPVGERRQIGALLAARDRFEVVAEQRLRVEQQPPEQGALAVVDGPRGGEAQEVALAGRRRHQK
jgi:hypothetical protein